MSDQFKDEIDFRDLVQSTKRPGYFAGLGWICVLILLIVLAGLCAGKG